MANFNATTDFILSHKDLAYGTDFPIETGHNGQVRFTLSSSAKGFKIDQFNLVVLGSGSDPVMFSVDPRDVEKAILVGRPLIPGLLSKLNARQDLIALAGGAVYDVAEVFEAFTLGDVTARIAYDPAPLSPNTPAGYRLTIKTGKGKFEHFGLAIITVAKAMGMSEPVLGYAIDLNPVAAEILVEAIGKSVIGMKKAYQSDIDSDAVSSVSQSTNLPTGNKPRV